MTHITRADESHVSGIHKVECECFSQPWSENALIAELNNGHSALFAAVCNDEVVGWAGLEAVFGEASVTNIAVLKKMRGQGLGRKLTEALINECRKEGYISLTLEVRVSNDTAISLYKSLGFENLGIRPKFYDFPTEDAMMMKLEIV